MAYFRDENHFKTFASTLESALEKYVGAEEESRLHTQRRQIKTLAALEDKFRKTLIKHPWGASVYRSFAEFIINENILAARPYFRERQEIFSSQISRALKKNAVRDLYKFRFNYNFIEYAMKCHKWPAGGKLATLKNEIAALRMEILETNMPLAISQARMFWASTPKSHLTFMDLVQIHAVGLLVAIDKFVPPGKGLSESDELEAYRKFRAVAIGRMMGDRVEEYSSTLIHYWPQDKRKIYRANKARRLFGENFEQIAEYVNEGVEEKKHRTNPDEVSELLASSSCVSGDMSLDPEGETTFDRYEAEDRFRPDVVFEEKSVILSVRDQYKALTMVEQKFLKLKGIEV